MKRTHSHTDEIPAILTCDGLKLNAQHLPEGLLQQLDDRYGAGIRMMYELLSREIPRVQQIFLHGIIIRRTPEEAPEFHTFTVSVQTEVERYHIGLQSATRLLRDNGIPYARITALPDLP